MNLLRIKKFTKWVLRIFLIVIYFNSSMANIYTSVVNGSWDDCSVWNTCLSGGTIPGNGDDVVINNTIFLNSNILINNITILGGSLTINNYSLTISGIINGPNSDQVYSNQNSSLVITGSTSQLTLPINIVVLKKLTLNRSAGAYCSTDLDLAFNNGASIPADSIVLVLTNGIFELANTKILQMNAIAIQRNIPCSDNSYVDGKISRLVNKNGHWFFYPVGDGGKCRPMALQNTSNPNVDDDPNIIRFFKSTPTDYLNYHPTLFGGVYNQYYWEHDNNGNQAGTQRRFYFNSSDFPNGIDLNDLTIVNYSNRWDPATGGIDNYVANSFYLQTSNDNKSNDLPWTFGSIDAGTVLPIRGITLTNESQNNKVLLSWKVVNQAKYSMYRIERSKDMKTFYAIDTVTGKAKKDNFITYYYSDAEPLEGVSYYRIAMLDTQIVVGYSSWVAINVAFEIEEGIELKSLYPIPVKDQLNIAIYSKNSQMVKIDIFTINGEKVYQQENSLIRNENTIVLNTSEMSEGVYFLLFSTKDKVFSKKFIKL